MAGIIVPARSSARNTSSSADGRIRGGTVRVLHVVSGLAPDGRFGGISRVALDLAQEQRRRGMHPHLVAADVGFERPLPSTLAGVPVTLLRSAHPLPALGFGTILSPGLPLAVGRLLRTADLVHVHLARDANTLLAARMAQLAHRPLVLQTHGMLDAPSNRIAHVVDRVLTGAVLRRASVVLTLADDEDAEVARLSRGAVAGRRFRNGVDVPEAEAEAHPRSGVLFLGRLHPRKGAVEFVTAAGALLADRPGLRFIVVGPDEGDGAQVDERIARSPVGIERRGAVDRDAARGLMRTAVLYCSPARDEPFGLTVVEALAEGTPVVVHESAALASAVRDARAGWTFGDHPTALEDVLRRAMTDPAELAERGRRGRLLAAEQYGLPAVVDELDRIYRRLLAGDR